MQDKMRAGKNSERDESVRLVALGKSGYRVVVDYFSAAQQAAPAGAVCAAAGEIAVFVLLSPILALTAAPIPAIAATAISQR